MEKVVYAFAGGGGAFPDAAPIEIGGEFYGTTALGGDGGCHAVHGCGVVYEVSASGQERIVHVFKSGSDGEAPNAALLNINGSLFGTTMYGGGNGCKSAHTSGCGTVFEVTPSGKELVRYRFSGGNDGALPDSSLTPFKGELYGEAGAGGTGNCYLAETSGCGTIFKISPSGRLQTIHTFEGGKEGGTPQGGLVLHDGNFYGTTSGGGKSCSPYSYGCGTVFKMSPFGSVTILYAFKGRWKDGATPQGGVVVVNGALYGTTYVGGKYDCALSGSGYGCGTVFEVTMSGQEHIVHNFKGIPDGALPNQLVAGGGNIYGTTEIGGSGGSTCLGPGCGTVFKLTPSGQETILYSFKSGSDGAGPTSALIENGGTLYGTTGGGGAHNDGTLYSVTP
ncbi:MAG: choice-of-anchor tandem repeat GloVer-containing protein [Candidatus Baltobacteraceae bacterium]